MINIHKTVYDPSSREDGKRILVMRIWPRGVVSYLLDLLDGLDNFSLSRTSSKSILHLLAGPEAQISFFARL
jgi:uncharacterized protein YeaO (DUF488 family)